MYRCHRLLVLGYSIFVNEHKAAYFEQEKSRYVTQPLPVSSHDHLYFTKGIEPVHLIKKFHQRPEILKRHLESKF